MKAVILAGGRGTRLGNLTADLPKPMVPIAGTPLLELQLGILKRDGITDIILSTGYQAEVIERHFGDGSAFGVRIEYAREDQPLGTAGALKALEPRLDDDFLVIYGDVVFDLNLPRLIEFHRSRAIAATLVLHPNDHPQDSDLVELDDTTRRVTAFHAKPHPPGHYYRNMVNAGAYVLSPRVLKNLSLTGAKDLGRHVFPNLVDQLPFYGYVTGEYIKDMGTPDRLRQVTADWTSGKVARLNNSHPRRAVFLDRDGTLNRHDGLVSRPEQIELLPGVVDGVRALNQSEFLTVVVTNQPVIARGLSTFAELDAIHGRLEGLLGAGHAKVDAVYFCPHHPDAGFPGERPEYKVRCECRKPGTGMIRAAADEYNIDLAGSYIIGDSHRDIECGRSVGLTTIWVATGVEWSANTAPADYHASDFADAVRWIMERSAK